MSTMTVKRESVTDLWARARAQVPPKYQQNIDFDNLSNIKTLEKLFEETDTSKQNAIDSRWTFTRKNKETVIIRDVFLKIIRWADSFKQVGDIVIQYDPGHAALPWAGIRFLLQIAVNDSIKLSSVVEGLARIAELICRFAVLETLYFQEASDAATELERALTKLYVDILSYLSMARQYVEEPTAKRMAKSGFLPNTQLETALDDIRKSETDVSHCQALVDKYDKIQDKVQAKAQFDQVYAKLIDLQASFEMPMQRMNDYLKNINDNLEESKRIEILQWCSRAHHMYHYKLALQDTIPGTGQWLLSDRTFKKWRDDSASSIFWLHGKLGSGKTKLASIVVEDAWKSFNSGNNPPPVFFYCSRDETETMRRDPHKIFASIARQLSCPGPGMPLLEPTVKRYSDVQANGLVDIPLLIDESYELILELTQFYPLTTIVIDALDECDLENQSKLLDFLANIIQKSTNLVKVFISSRDDAHIKQRLRDCPNIEVNGRRNGDDIAKFVKVDVEKRIQDNRLLCLSESTSQGDLKKLLIDEVIEGADGMFRWASMQLQYLCTIKIDDDIKDHLGHLSEQKLNDLYSGIYNVLSTQPGDNAAAIFENSLHWLLCAQRSLTIKEFLAAISTGPQTGGSGIVTKDKVLDICTNFIIFDSDLDTFRFAHLSVREFLEQRHGHSSSTMHALAAEICLRNIVSTKPDSPSQGSIFRINKEAKPEGQKFDGFRRYSDLYWAVHCRLAVGKRDQEMLKDTLDTFLSGSGDGTSSIENWAVRIQTYPRNDDDLFFLWDSELEYPEELEDVQPAKEFAEATGLFVCCAFDLEEFLERLVGGDMRKMTWLNSKGRTPLQAAARNGSYNVLKRLLGQGEKTISITKDVIEEAARNSSNGNKMMELLLRWHGGNVSITITLVEAAARNYGKGKDIMMLLLKQDSADILILEVTKAIAKHFDQEVIECLLRRPGTDQSAIKAIIEGASRNYNSSNHIMDFLLKICRVEMLVTDDIIAEITENFEENIMKSLLDQPEADVSITDAVVEAAARNYKNGKNIMKLLLGQCRVDMSTEAIVLGITKHFDQEVMDCLLKRLGVDTVLLTEEVVRAARLNYKDGNNIMKLLLGRCRVDISPEVIILEITKHFDQEVMDCLLTRLGANSVLLTEEVVKAAAIWNYKNRNDIMKLLIQKGTVEIPIAEAIVLAIVRNFDQEVMECLLDGPGVGTSDTQDIFKAAAANYTDGENLIAVLLERFKAEVSITESIIKAVVGNSGQGKEIIVLLLDQHGLDISVTKGVVESAAANFQHGKDIMKLLINKTRSGMPITEATVLEIAERFDQDVMSYLLTQRRADIIVTTKLVASIARRFDQETMKCLLDRQDVEVSVTESIVRAAARNSNSSYGKGVIKLLLSQSRVKIPTEETGIAITEHFDQETMEILLARTDVEVSVTESIVRAAAWNSSHGKGVMKRLLNQCRIEMSMEELVLAVIRDFDQEVIDCLLGRPGVDVLLTEKIVSAAVYTYKDVKAIMKSLLDGCKNDQPITEKMVLEITKRFDQDVMTCLLKNYGGDMPITEEIVLEIAQKFDQHTIADLFAQREGVVPVTKRIIEIIARRFDQDLLASLLGRPGADVLVTKAVVEAAAANSEHGKGVMTLLLDRYKSRVSIAESVVVNIVRNSGNGREIMALVLKKSGVGVSVTGRVVKAAANNPTNGNGILKLLIDHYRTDIPITEVIEAIAQHSDQDVMNCLLDRSRADVLVTESVVEAAAANSKNGKEIMRLLFNRYRKGLQFTETTVVTVAKRFGPEVIKFLLDQRGADALVTEAVVEAAARNRDFRHSENGKDIIKKLIDKYQKDWPIREVIQAIAENFDREVMEHLLKRLGSDILVTEGVVRAAAQNYKNSNDIMKLLLQKGTVEIPVAEETVVSIAQNFDKETMAYLLSTYGATITITDAVMVAITERFDQDVVGPLLKLRGADILVTKAMIKAAAVKPYGDNRESIRLLLGHRGGNTSFTEAIIEAAGGNWPGGEKMILLLFDQWISHIQVTEEVVEVVAGNQHGDELMVLLFDRRGEDVRITDGTVKAAAGNENCGDKVIDLLLSQRGEEIWITDGVVRAAAGNENCGERVMNILLNRQGGDIQITEDVLKAVANEAYDAKVMTLFLDQRGDEFQITEEVVKAAAGNECCGDEVLELLLNRRGEEVQITEEVVKAAAGNECCGDLVLELLLDRRGGEFQITEEVAKAAAGNECCGDEVLELLLDRRRGEFQITEEVVKAAVSNIGRGYKVMRHLRNRRGGDSQVTEDAKVAIERFWS